MKLNEEELKNINGGGISLGATLFFGGIITFFIGLFDGQIKLK